jgi:hypothetical protein
MPAIRLHRGPFGLATLDEAYQSAVYGYNEPDILRCSVKIQERILKLFDFFRVPGKKGFLFNNAKLTVDETLPDNKVRFENSHCGIKARGLGGETLYKKMNVEVEFTD